MIDTVRVKFLIAPTTSQLKAWDHRRTEKATTGEVREQYMLNRILTPFEISIRCTYLPRDYAGNPMLAVELSLAKALYGNNFTMVDNLASATDRANELLTLIDGLPPLDITQGQVIRIDPCYNHHVGELVPHYINAIGKLEYPHRRTKHHRNEGAEFRSKHTTTKFYDKQRETRNPLAAGILRQETTMLKGKQIAERMGIEHPILCDVTKEWLRGILILDLMCLRIEGRPIPTRETALTALRDAYGPRAGIYYWALLQLKADTSKRQAREATGLHPRSLDRQLRKIAEAGIPPTFTDAPDPLPPLRIDL